MASSSTLSSTPVVSFLARAISRCTSIGRPITKGCAGTPAGRCRSASAAVVGTLGIGAYGPLFANLDAAVAAADGAAGTVGAAAGGAAVPTGGSCVIVGGAGGGPKGGGAAPVVAGVPAGVAGVAPIGAGVGISGKPCFARIAFSAATDAESLVLRSAFNLALPIT